MTFQDIIIAFVPQATVGHDGAARTMMRPIMLPLATQCSKHGCLPFADLLPPMDRLAQTSQQTRFA